LQKVGDYETVVYVNDYQAFLTSWKLEALDDESARMLEQDLIGLLGGAASKGDGVKKQWKKKEAQPKAEAKPDPVPNKESAPARDRGIIHMQEEVDERRENKAAKEKRGPRKSRNESYVADSVKDEISKKQGEVDALREKLKEREEQRKKKEEFDAVKSSEEDAQFAKSISDFRCVIHRTFWPIWLALLIFVASHVTLILIVVYFHSGLWSLSVLLHIPLVWLVKHFRVSLWDHEVKFVSWHKRNNIVIDMDYRPDTMTSTALKHQLPRVAIFQILRQVKWWHLYRTPIEVVLSVEALAQLCAPSIVAPYMAPDVVVDRLKYSAQTLSSVQEIRMLYVDGIFPIAQAIIVAYAIYWKSRCETFGVSGDFRMSHLVAL
jgi:hypothetical protein